MEPLTREQIDDLRNFDTPTICNAIEQFKTRQNTEGFMTPGMIRRSQFTKPLVGYAATARVSGTYKASALANEALFNYYEHVRSMPDPSISVVQDIDIDQSYSFWGEVQASTHQSLGCVGAIVDGGVRDIPAAEKIGFDFFSTKVNVSHGYVHLVDYGKPAQILGLTINPGDLLHADMHGVTIIPPEIAPLVADKCRQMLNAENEFLAHIRAAIASGEKPTIEQLREWRKRLIEQRNA